MKTALMMFSSILGAIIRHTILLRGQVPRVANDESGRRPPSVDPPMRRLDDRTVGTGR